MNRRSGNKEEWLHIEEQKDEATRIIDRCLLEEAIHQEFSSKDSRHNKYA